MSMSKYPKQGKQIPGSESEKGAKLGPHAMKGKLPDFGKSSIGGKGMHGTKPKNSGCMK